MPPMKCTLPLLMIALITSPVTVLIIAPWTSHFQIFKKNLEFCYSSRLGIRGAWQASIQGTAICPHEILLQEVGYKTISSGLFDT